jgi:hypothetical protein
MTETLHQSFSSHLVISHSPETFFGQIFIFDSLFFSLRQNPKHLSISLSLLENENGLVDCFERGGGGWFEFNRDALAILVSEQS